MQPDNVGFFEGDLGEIESKLRACLYERNNTTDKLRKQILTVQIRELRDKLVSSKPVQPDENYNIPVSADETGLFDGDIGRIESQLRDAVKRKASCTSQCHRDSLQREVNDLVELLKSPIIHAHSNLSIDTKKLWNLIRGQNITSLLSVDPVLLKTLRDSQTGHSALHRAALMGNPSLVELLVKDKQCDVNSICHNGQTPLHIAVEVENIEVAKKLMELGADISVADAKGRSPFDGIPKFIKNQFFEVPVVESSSDDVWDIAPNDILYGEAIGEGATSVVYAGSIHDRPVAVKEFPAIQRTEFNREVRILMKLKHPNLVEFIGSSSKEKLLLIMELCAGGSLYSLLHEQKFKLSFSQVVAACRGILEGLRYLHSQDPQIIHMDLKSRNILLQAAVRGPESNIGVKIADFGISRIASVTSGRLAGPAIAGTWFWMSPETLVGDLDEISTKSDMYSFSICLFEMLSGELPFASVEGLDMLPPVTIAIKIANGFRPDVTRIVRTEPGVATLVGLMEQTWSYEPKERLSAQSFLEALDNVAD